MTRVAIIGAGPTGAALSLLLARRGVDTTLIERELSFDRVFRGEALMPSGWEALRQLGLGDALDQLPHVVVPCMELFVESRRIVRADWPELAGTGAARVVSQPALLGLLVREARRHPHFGIRLGTRLTGFEPAGGHLRLEIESAAGKERLDCELLVGADGRASLVRSRAGIPLERLPFPADVAWMSLPAPESQRRDPRFQSHVTGGRTLVLYPSWDGRIRAGVHVTPEEARAFAEDYGGLLDLMARIAGEPYATLIDEQRDRIAAPVLLRVLIGRCPEWTADHLLLLGDAAHPMAPVRAQGINLALRDAIVAANRLLPPLLDDDNGALAAATRLVQEEREPEIVTIQRLQLAALRLPPPIRSPLRRATLLPLLRGSGLLKRRILAAERPLRFGTTEVRLVA